LITLRRVYAAILHSKCSWRNNDVLVWGGEFGGSAVRLRPKGVTGAFPGERPVRTCKRSFAKQRLKAKPGDSGHSRIANADPAKSKVNGCISLSRTGAADP
jgi:hypothetical protein